MFDSTGNGIKRSYIGPINYLSQERAERALTPSNLAEELNIIKKNRRQEFENTKLSGKHAPCSMINNPGVVKIRPTANSSFLMTGSSNRKKRNKTRLMTGSTENIREPNKNHENIIVEEKGSNMQLSQNYMQRRKRTCGCSSAIQISTPKHTVFSQGAIGPSTWKEQLFQDTLKDTRKERTQKNFQGIHSFWEKFKKRWKHSVRLKKPYSLLQLSDDFPAKYTQRMNKNKKGVQSGLNKWLFSLRKGDDPSRKHFEACNSISDPNRAIWAHVNEEKSYSRINFKKTKGLSSKNIS